MRVTFSASINHYAKTVMLPFRQVDIHGASRQESGVSPHRDTPVADADVGIQEPVTIWAAVGCRSQGHMRATCVVMVYPFLE